MGKAHVDSCGIDVVQEFMPFMKALKEFLWNYRL